MKMIVYAATAVVAIVVGGFIAGGDKPGPVGLHKIEPAAPSTNPHMAHIGTRALCPQIGPMAIVLPDDKDRRGPDLYAQAYRLNDQGICVIEGGFGRSLGLYYLAVRNHDGGRPYFLRYSDEELSALKRP